MSSPPFRETCSLSDAIELIGRRLFAHEWTGQEYRRPKVMSPEILSDIRSPLEDKLRGFAAEHKAIQLEISRTIDSNDIERLKGRRHAVEARWSALSAMLNRQFPPLNDVMVSAHASNERWMAAEGTLLSALRGRQLKVHDGRGAELSFSVWEHPHFHYYIELSIVVNSKLSGEPRRQAARIDRSALEDWLKTLKAIVEPTQTLSVEDKLRDYLKSQVEAVRGRSQKKTKSQYRSEAMSNIPGVSKRLFERLWAEVVPKAWRKAGAPKTKSSRS